MHPDAVKLQRQACMAIRNMVVRNQDLIDAVLGEGAENAINVALASHKDCKDEATAALRDLHCKVRGPWRRLCVSPEVYGCTLCVRVIWCARGSG